ncbi:acyl-CoA dehydrogenase family protein [Actinomadura sp. WMMB 499]|uniref:acyl-CoA dehydrogenase family protein n=1 Tax=Actinomadura sp. WMMB 499 TaxID=1219491 RepID=UPI001244037A|nr:acyl-CoA dehydrogenase family protein [Actinomadura sp. WMMB 499]QFG24532.1 acyl-CoA dehydrogenase [Actinomadura sp. WMMB 499]
MDFTLGEELEAVRDLARRILTDHATPERLRAAEETGVDEALWKELAAAGLLGVALPESAGGAGLGLSGLCVLLEEQGRTVAPVPLWPALVAGLTLAGHGTCPPEIADGTLRYTLALEEFGPHDPADPACRAVPDGGAWRLTGTKAAVPSAPAARRMLVSAASPDGPALFAVDTDAPGTSWEHPRTTAHDVAGTVVLDGAPAERLGGGALATALRLARLALAAVQLGVAEGALRMTADYLSAREQFGRPLGTFQAVQHQLADSYIEIDALRVCLWHAISLSAAGEDAEQATLVAKWWSDEGGLNVVHRTQHLHGGIGVDVDYPIHRYFLWGKQISGTLGGASADLALLGATL